MSHDQRGETASPPHVSEGDVLPVDSESESLDAVFRALADHRRRCVCHYLARSDDPVPVAELAELLAASTTGKSRAVVTTSEVEKTRAELTRMHLPKLAEVGLVEHDRESGVVEFVGSPGVRACLDAAATVDFE